MSGDRVPGDGDTTGKRIGRRSGLTRFELVVTVFMVTLAVAGLAALVPLATGGDGGAVATPSANPVVQLNDAELAGPRSEAALQACPGGSGQAAPPAVRPAAARQPLPARPPPPDPPAQPAPPAAQPQPAPPAPAPPAQPADAGPLAGIEVPCLGAPGTVRVAAALAGRETLLNVWASWCVPCKEELPALQAYAARPEAVPVLGVNVRDNPVLALRLLAQLKIHLPMVVDSGGALTGKLKTIALPASFLLRPDGTVTQLLPQVAYTEATEVADAVAAARVKAGK